MVRGLSQARYFYERVRTMAEKYNGWTNYESWCLNLWMTNDQGSQEYWAEQAQDAWDNTEPDEGETRDESAIATLRDSLKAQFEDQKDELLEEAKLSCSVWADLLGAALSEVNWHEIAEALIADVNKEIEA